MFLLQPKSSALIINMSLDYVIYNTTFYYIYLLKMMLPPIKDQIKSSRLNTLEDYSLWQKQKKQAYRAELDKELQTLYQKREQSHTRKIKEKSQMNMLMEFQKRQQSEQKYKKIKTEQKYMKDNFNLMQQLNKYNPEIKYQNILLEQPKEHPFIKLIDQQQQRKKQTKKNFQFQNKLNDIQKDMRRQQVQKLKKMESEQSKMLMDHEEEYYKNKKKERLTFQRKYLKIDKNNDEDHNKEYLHYLKEQQKSQRDNKTKFESSYNEKLINNVSPGSIGSTFAAHDRIRQMQSIQKSLAFFDGIRNTNIRSSFQTRKPDQQKNPMEKSKIFQKIITERAPEQKSKQPANKSLINKMPRRNIETLDKCLNNSAFSTPRTKEFISFDIILGRQRKIISKLSNQRTQN